MTKDVFLDSDFIRNFAIIKQIDIVCFLYPGRLKIPSEVYRELKNQGIASISYAVGYMIDNGHGQVVEGDENGKVLEIYLNLKQANSTSAKRIGRGELHALAFAIYYDGIVASNNFSDVAIYVEQYKLEHISAAKTLCDAVKAGMITPPVASMHWVAWNSRDRWLPTSTFNEYFQDYYSKGIL